MNNKIAKWLLLILCLFTLIIIGNGIKRGVEASIEREIQLDKEIAEYKKQIDELELSITNLQNELQSKSDKLDGANETLSRFINPIDYDSAAATIYNIPLSEELQNYTYNVCRYYGIEDQYEVVLAVMWHESHFNPDAVSETNDYGIMQINQCNHDYLYSTLGIVDIMDPKDNIHSGVYILSTLFDKYETADKVLMAYNMGPGNASDHWADGIYTSAYSEGVLDKAELIECNNYNLE